MRVILLAAVAVVAVTGPIASAGLSTRVGAPLRTVYVATAPKALPNTAFVRARDCVRRPRTCVNGIGGRELVYLTSGRLPPRAMTATVLTDTDCAADRNGISHCGNVMRLASGRVIGVRHDHNMMNDPCLSPGERVHVRPLR